MRRWPTFAAFALVFVMSSGALAGPAPYTDWAFDVRRANEAEDPKALAELARAQPDFARIWFYGQIFDLVTVGLADEVKAQLRPQLRVLADTLAGLEPPDGRPLLYLDWAQTGRLAELAPRARELQDQWVNAVRADQPLPARLAAAEHPEAARPVFYMLFFRAELAARRLGGVREKALLLRVARRMAEGFALATGDTVPWRTLSGYMGQPGGVPLAGEGVVEAQVGGALNGYLIGDLVRARAGLDTALSTSRQARTGSIFVALVMNGAAHAANWLGDHVAERALRVRVLQAVRPLKIPNVVALVADQMVRAHLADASIDDMVAYTREMREMGDVVMRTGRHLRTMELAAEALVQTAWKRFDQGKLAASERVIEEAGTLLSALIEDDAVAITTPSDRAPTVKRQRQIARTELVRLSASIAERRGRLDLARAGFGQVRAAYEGTVPDGPRLASADLDLARVVLAAGDPDAAIQHATTARKTLGATGAVESRATASLRLGHARLVRGDPAPAFAHANEGLALLRAAGVADANTALRAELHVIAAAALDMAGMSQHAVTRIAFALKLTPKDARVARIAAVARAEAGDADGAREALAPIAAGLDGREARVLQSCILVRAGRHAEAIPGLKALIPQLTLPHLRNAQIVGRTCLAAAQLEAGNARGAADALRPARALVLEYPDPMLVWRVQALDGAIAAANRRWLDAAGAWRQAMDRLTDAASERPQRGATLDLRTLAMPADGGAFIDRVPSALVDSARADRSDAATHHAAAVSAARWSNLSAAAPDSASLDRLRVHPAVDRGTRAAIHRVGALRSVLADPAVVTAERVAATQAMRQAAAAVREAAGALSTADARFADYYSPSPAPVIAPAGEALVIYRVEQARTHLWVIRPELPPSYYALPGRDALNAALAPAIAAIAEKPADWSPQSRRVKDPNASDWKTLEAAGRVVLPFVRDKAMAESLAGLKLRVVTDGPLVRFPLDALLVASPARRADGSAPPFFGARFDVTYAVMPRAAGKTSDAALAIGMFGPLGPAAAGCPEGVKCTAGADEFAIPLRALDGFVTVRGAETTDAGLKTALMGADTLVVTSPVALDEGAFVTSPVEGDETYGRLRGEALAESGAQASAVILLTPVGDPSGWHRLGAALTAAGVQTIVMPAAPDRQDVGRLAERLAAQTALRSAVFGELRDAITARIDPTVGGKATHHPHYWARWVVYGQAMDRATLDAGVKPLAPPPADPYADDPAEPDTPAGGTPAPPAVDPYG